jgi:hypothetical protein
MIPRNRLNATVRTDQPSTAASGDVQPTSSLPPVQHTAIDWDFTFGSHTLPITSVDGAVTVEELADRYLVTTADETLTILKAGLLWVRCRQRTFETPGEIFIPAEVKRGQ